MKDKQQVAFLQSFGKNFASIRNRQRITQEQLSFDTGLDVTTISKIERGLLNISSYNAFKLAKAMNVHVRELYDFTP